MKFNLRCLPIVLLFALCASGVSASEAFPRLEGEKLSGGAVTLPDIAKGHPTLLIVSFSRRAQSQTAEWGKKIKAHNIDASGFEFYQVLELEDVPRLFRGMAKSGIKNSVPAEEQSRFVLLFQGSEALKKLAAHQKDEDAYLVLLDGAGNIQWRGHGPVSDTGLKELEKQIKKLAPSK